YQWVSTRVKPERGANNRASYRDAWWIFGEPRKDFRPALAGLSRYISTAETAKHRFFVFLPEEILPDNMLVNIASSDACHLGILSSRVHVCWALAAGGRLGVGNDPRYNKSRCFDTFPFPDATPGQQERIRDLGEQIDDHRKQRQALYPDLTMTGMYNVLEALRQDRELTDAEETIHENGLVTVLRELHDELDDAVSQVYGWTADLPDEEILARLVRLNAERAKEEEEGTIRYLRPEYQDREGRKATQAALKLDEQAARSRKAARAKEKKITWPSSLPEQTLAVRDQACTLRRAETAVTVDAVARQFIGANRARVGEILRTLETLGFT
ncbi:MAG: class I SAM-dependent DNA methyltransferase, partial [Alphaproteobacteria bacterium]|nr:class I SAM-dependent DNA methyltransferase [Alphaproteobacteria bacterium]